MVPSELVAKSRHSLDVYEEAEIAIGAASCQPEEPRARRRRLRALATTGVIGVAALSIAACGSSSSSSSSGSSSSSSSAPSSSSSSAASGQGANVAAASAAIAPYVGHPSAFPVNKPLGKPLPPGTRFVFLQCSSTFCALTAKLLVPAVKAIGGTLTIVNAGATASSSQAAASSALGLKPAAVLVTGISPSLFANSLRRLDAAGIKVTAVGVIKPERYGIEFSLGGLGPNELAGKLMADWVIVHKGPKANVVFYGVPELDFSSYLQQAFEQEMAKNCPSCKVRAVPISVTTTGTTAPQTVVADLQSHPDTNMAVFGDFEEAAGLPAALKTAGLSITTLGNVPTPENLQDIKSGALTAGLGVDVAVSAWTLVDATARLLLHEPLTPVEQTGETPTQFLMQKDITFDPAKGWTGYPAFPLMFVKLWHPAP